MNRVISVPLDAELASFIGKKGSANGITFYDRRMGGDVIVALYPTSAADKPYGIAESMLVADLIVISTANVGREFGEALVAASLVGKKVFLTNDNDVGRFLSGGLLADYEIVGREELLDKVVAYRAGRKEGMVRVDVDKAFPVTGIGTVALGVVASGTVRVHDTLYHNSGKSITVRSMQSQDIDIKEAQPGTRVGLAIKGMEHDEIEKGDVFASTRVPNVTGVRASLKLSAMANEMIGSGSQYLLVSSFSHANATVSPGDEAQITLEKPMPLMAGDRILLMRRLAPRIFASGVVTQAL